MKIIDEREKGKKQRQKERKECYSESVRAKGFCCAFKLGFIQLALSIFFKERELYYSKHAVVKCKCLKIYETCYLFDMFLNPSFKIASFKKCCCFFPKQF